MDDHTPSYNQHDSSSTPVAASRAAPASASNPPATTSSVPFAKSLAGSATPCKKRQRGRGVITAHACTECRIKRAKCDGQKPCRRCKLQEIDCHYKIPTRQSKMHLRNTIEQLRCQQASNTMVFNALSHSRKWKEVLCQLRSGRSIEAIASWLGNQPSFGSCASPSLSHLSGADTSLSNLASFASTSEALYPPEYLRDGSVSASTAGSISSDSLSGCGYKMDTDSEWSQYLEAGHACPSRSNSVQTAPDSSQLLDPSLSTNDLVAFWANSMSMPVAPSPASFAVAGTGAGDSMQNSLFWPFPVPGQQVLPTGDAFGGVGF